jgi:acetyl esterase/lipase
MKRLAVAVFVLLGLAAPAAAQIVKPDVKFHFEDGLVFGKVGDRELKLDLYAPAEGNGPFPAVVCVHGGGWRGGNRKQLADLGKGLAQRGYVAVCVEYRLTPKDQFPAQIEDAKCAVRWLRANAKKHKVNPDRIGSVGASAGGHLVCLLGLTLREDKLEGSGDLTKEASSQSSAVQAVVSFFGPTDLTREDWSPAVQPLLSDFLGGTFKDKPENYKKASPIIYAIKGRTRPPFLFFHGTKDPIVAYGQSVLLHEALKKLGADSDLVTMEGHSHGWLGKDLEDSFNKTVTFLDKHLK